MMHGEKETMRNGGEQSFLLLYEMTKNVWFECCYCYCRTEGYVCTFFVLILQVITWKTEDEFETWFRWGDVVRDVGN